MQRRKEIISTHDLTKRSTIIFYNSFLFVRISTHDLTKRSTSSFIDYTSQKKYFNSRPHEEVDRLDSQESNVLYTHFNSRPHEEVDCRLCLIALILFNFNSRPHEEVDSALCIHRVECIIFQLTTSRRGRRYHYCTRWGCRGISTHDLTKRSTTLNQIMF